MAMREIYVEDVARAALVKALLEVLQNQALTRGEKPDVAALLEAEIAALVCKGSTSDTEIAHEAVRRAVRSYRFSQGVISASALAEKILAPARRLKKLRIA